MGLSRIITLFRIHVRIVSVDVITEVINKVHANPIHIFGVLKSI